jgi:hypothetical protein
MFLRNTRIYLNRILLTLTIDTISQEDLKPFSHLQAVVTVFRQLLNLRACCSARDTLPFKFPSFFFQLLSQKNVGSLNGGHYNFFLPPILPTPPPRCTGTLYSRSTPKWHKFTIYSRNRLKRYRFIRHLVYDVRNSVVPINRLKPSGNFPYHQV